MFNKKLLALALALVLSASAQNTTGKITGMVMDSQTGRPVAGATIHMDGAATESAKADLNGKFSFSAPAGTHTLKYSAPNYNISEISEVKVVAGEETEASTIISNKSFVTTVDVSEKADAVSATAEAMLVERKLSATVSDSIGRLELSSSTASDAAGALEKVTGVSVVGEGFVFVRGLGERYSATQLNGALIPTTEPEKRVVPLDLFPAAMIESIKIAKTYTPDLPAEFSGGLVQLQTIEFPTKKVLSASIKSRMNSETAFNRFLVHPGNSALPSIIPNDKRLIAGQFTTAQLQEFGRAFSNTWEPTVKTSAPPTFDFSVNGGGTFGRLGVVAALTRSNKTQTQHELQRYIRQSYITEYPDYVEHSDATRIGAVVNAALKINNSNKIIFRNTFTREKENSARQFVGYDGGVDSTISSERLRYIERDLLATGVEGEHSLLGFKNSLIHWQFTYSKTKRDEPDLREVFRGQLPDGSFIFSALSTSASRFYSKMNDHIYEPQVDFSIPFYNSKVAGLFKTGVRATIRRRDFQARRFRFVPIQTASLNLFLPSNQLFAPANISSTGFQIIEFTRGTDHYDAEMNIYAGYSMVDISFGSKVRLVGGVRFEASEQNVITVDNLVPNAQPETASLQNTDPVPALNFIYTLAKNQNLRFSVSRTLSRPDFRELSPFDFNNVLGGFVSVGNPKLKRAAIINYDGRWEWFTGGNQLVAISAFAKTFTDPIEQTIIPSNDLRQSFVNAKGARNVGLELEFRRSLATISKSLRDFGLASNFTFVDSKIDIRPEDATLLTSTSRPLLGQSKYLFNGALQWSKPKWRSDARASANYTSKRITDLGTFKLPDIYQDGNISVDFAYDYSFTEANKWKLRFEAENLTNNPFRWFQGDLTQREYRNGRTYQIGLTYSIF